MINDLELFHNNEKKYLKKVNNLIKYYNFIVTLLKYNTKDYDYLPLYNIHTSETMLLLLYKIRFSFLEQIRAVTIDTNEQFILHLYTKNLINLDMYNTYINTFIDAVDNSVKLSVYCTNLYQYIDINYYTTKPYILKKAETNLLSIDMLIDKNIQKIKLIQKVNEDNITLLKKQFINKMINRDISINKLQKYLIKDIINNKN